MINCNGIGKRVYLSVPQAEKESDVLREPLSEYLKMISDNH